MRAFVFPAVAVVAALILAGSAAPAASARADVGTLQIRGLIDVDTPVLAGAVVRIDGVNAGVTDNSGSLSVTQPAGPAEVSVVVPSMARGTASATAVDGQTTQVDVMMTEGEQAEPSTLTLAELSNGGLDLATDSITFRFRRPDDGTPIAIDRIDEVTLRTPINTIGKDLTSMFGVGPDGAVIATNLPGVTDALGAELSAVSLSVQGTDAQGLTYADSVDVAPGLNQVTVALRPPPSRPDLPVAGLTAQVRYGTVNTTATAGADGRLVLNNVPAGAVSVSAATSADGLVYTGFADPGVRADGVLTVTLLGLADVLAGASPWRIDQDAGASPQAVRERRPARQRAAGASADANAADDTAEVFVAGAAEYDPQTGNAQLTVPQGTENITLSYEVRTEEYPDFVEGQSRYNDTWGLSVLGADGRLAFSVNRSVNSQLSNPPTWNDGGGTGMIAQQIDVSELTADADATLTLAAMSTNIGDDFLPAEVTASLSTQPSLSVTAIRADTIPPFPGRPNQVVNDRFSIPRPNQANTRQRQFDVDFTKPANVSITNARVDLLNTTNPRSPALLQTVTNAPPTANGADGVLAIDADTLRVRVTFDAQHQSAVTGTPPAAGRIRYRVTLTGRDQSGAMVTATQDSAAYFPLWRMPDGFGRYSVRDAGGDDWCSQFTYNWLDNNRNLVTRINDISGEHGRNLDHATHLTGRDIDLYHAYSFPGINAGGQNAGTANYNALVTNTQAAMNGDQPALGRVADWARATRTLFDQLIANRDVVRIYYARGNTLRGEPRLQPGWARDLFRNGSYTFQDPATGQPRTLNLGIGAWANNNNQVIRAGDHNNVHDNHFHLTLRG